MSELNKRKKLLVIGAGDFQLPLVQKASETCDVFLAAPVISEAFYPYIKGRLLKDVRDEEAILTFAKDQGIDGVITDQTDIAVRSVAYVSEKMGLPGIGCETGTTVSFCKTGFGVSTGFAGVTVSSPVSPTSNAALNSVIVW